MNSGMFAVGVVTGLAGAAAAVMAVNYRLAGTDLGRSVLGRSVSRTAHHTAGMVSRAAHEAADTVDRMVSD